MPQSTLLQPSPTSPAPSTPTTRPAPSASQKTDDDGDQGPLSHQRLTRYRDLLPITKLTSTPVIIIGCGAIGRQVALSLATMGVQKMILQDHDKVSGINLGTQGWKTNQLNTLKVIALEDEIALINPDCDVDPDDEMFTPKCGLPPRHAVFACVDNMDVRKQIFNAWQGCNPPGSRHYPLFDCRMGASSCHLLSVHDGASMIYYDSKLFPQSEAEAVPCTAAGTFFNACIGANLLVAQYCHWLQGNMPEPHLSLNLLSMELSVEKDNPRST